MSSSTLSGDAGRVSGAFWVSPALLASTRMKRLSTVDVHGDAVRSVRVYSEVVDLDALAVLNETLHGRPVMKCGAPDPLHLPAHGQAV
jgi:hypothetical protein